MLNTIIILALLNTTIIHCAKKWGWIDLIQAHGWVKTPCWLCAGFWMAVVELFIFINIGVGSLQLETNGYYIFITPFCSAAITNYLVNAAIINDRR